MFLLVNEETIKRYKSDLADEVEPTITELIERAEQGLAALEKKEALLKTKVRILNRLIRSITDCLSPAAGGCSSTTKPDASGRNSYTKNGSSSLAIANQAKGTPGRRS